VLQISSSSSSFNPLSLQLEGREYTLISLLKISSLLSPNPSLRSILSQIISQPSQQNPFQMLKGNKSRLETTDPLLQSINLCHERLVASLLLNGLRTQTPIQVSFDIKLRAKSFVLLLLDVKVEAELGELGAEFDDFEFLVGC
jgi:hypothetical protein